MRCESDKQTEQPQLSDSQRTGAEEHGLSYRRTGEGEVTEPRGCNRAIHIQSPVSLSDNNRMRHLGISTIERHGSTVYA